MHLTLPIAVRAALATSFSIAALVGSGCAAEQMCRPVGPSSTDVKELSELYANNRQTPLVLYKDKALVCSCDSHQQSAVTGSSDAAGSANASGNGRGAAGSASGSGSASGNGAGDARGGETAGSGAGAKKNERSYGGAIGASTGEIGLNSQESLHPAGSQGTMCHVQRPTCPTYVVSGVGSDKEAFPVSHPSVFDGKQIHELQPDLCVR